MKSPKSCHNAQRRERSLTKGLANIIPILLSTAGSRCNITDTKQRNLLTKIPPTVLTNQFSRLYSASFKLVSFALLFVLFRLFYFLLIIDFGFSLYQIFLFLYTHCKFFFNSNVSSRVCVRVYEYNSQLVRRVSGQKKTLQEQSEQQLRKIAKLIKRKETRESKSEQVLIFVSVIIISFEMDSLFLCHFFFD